MGDTIRDWWEEEFLKREGWTAVVLTIAFGVWLYVFGGFQTLDGVLGHNRSDIYSAAATIFGSLLGFSIVLVSVVMTAVEAGRLRILRESQQYSTMWDVFLGTIRWLGVATVAALAALVFDRPENPERWLVVVLFLTTAFAVARLLRSVWVLENIIASFADAGEPHDSGEE